MDTGFFWDEMKRRQVFKEHDVNFYEVVSAFDDQRGLDLPDPQHHEDRYLLVGYTVTARILVIVYEALDEAIYRIITAFDAEGAYRHAYEQE